MQDPFEGTQYSVDNMVQRHGGHWQDVWVQATMRRHTPTTTLVNGNVTMTIDNHTGNATIQGEHAHVEGLGAYLTRHNIPDTGWSVQRPQLYVVK